MTRLFAMGVLAFALTGCGTNANLCLPSRKQQEQYNNGLGGPPQLGIYGGVANDVDTIMFAAESRKLLAVLIIAGCVVDLPLSAIGDTITLPLTMPASVNRSLNDYYSQKPGTPQPPQLPQWLADSQPTPIVPPTTPAP